MRILSRLALVLIICSAVVSTASAMESYKYLEGIWANYTGKHFDQAIAAIDLCVAEHGAYAAKLQEETTVLPTETAEVHKLGPLNDVATCLWIKGKILEEQGDKAGAIAAYKLLVSTYSKGQCWDANGWFWKPADAAKTSLVELEFADD